MRTTYLVEEINDATKRAIDSITEMSKQGFFIDTSDVLAYLSGYCRNEPIMINEIFPVIRKLCKEGDFKR